jgi:hypothetical protein
MKTCFECQYHPMCSAFKQVTECIPFDTKADDYNKRFEWLINAIAEICRMYKPRAEK